MPSTRAQPSCASSAQAVADAQGDASAPRTEGEVVIREGTVADIERIESLTLEDFAADFSKVQIPDKDGPLSDGEMKVAVDTFLSSLERT